MLKLLDLVQIIKTMKSLKVSNVCHCPLALLPCVEAPFSLPLKGRTTLAVSVGMAKNKGYKCLS
jgi:hypothetical protein